MSGTAASGLSPAGEIARRHDPDRFLTALFAPSGRREGVFALIALNHELSRAVEAVAGARSGARDGATGGYGDFGALVRLQWWREAIDGRPDRHEVAQAIATLAARGEVAPGLLERMIASREAEIEGVADLERWRGMVADGPGALARAIGQALDVSAARLDAVEAIGSAYGIGAMLRHREALVAAGRRLLPEAVPIEAMAAHGRALLAQATGRRGSGPVPRDRRAAFLLAPLARRDLARIEAPRAVRCTPRGLGERLAVFRAAIAPGGL